MKFAKTCLIALVSVGSALGLTLAISPVRRMSPFLFFALAVMVSASFRGLVPGLCATALSALSVAVFLPGYRVAVGAPTPLVPHLLFLVVGGTISYISARLRAANQRLANDIRRREEVERALRDSEAKFRAVLNSASQGILAVGETGLIEFANPRADEMFGYEPGELDGKPIEILIPERFRTAHAGHIGAFFCNPQPRPMAARELPALRKDGSEFAAELGLGATQLQGKRLSIAIVSDLSDRKRLEHQLEQSQKMEAIGQLAGGVAHDFNNLLTIISGYTDLALADIGRSAPPYAALSEVRAAAERAAGLTGQLLAFSRKQLITPRHVDLNTIVRRMENMLRRLIGEDVELIIATAEEATPVLADPGQIEQVIFNLAVNARDAMAQGGKLVIETGNIALDEGWAGGHLGVKPGPHVMLAITDTGHGMTEEVQKHLFEPFFTTKPPGKGTGLGLSTVYGIVKQNGGSIWVYSEAGRGTKFKIFFPRSQGDGQLEVEKPQTAPEAVSGGETVLLAEDEPGVRRFVRDILERHGYKVIEAASAEEALEQARQYQGDIDLLVTDVVMAHMSGIALADSLNELRPGTRVLFMSGYTDRVTSNSAETARRGNLIEKPFTASTLLTRINELLQS